MLQIDTYTFLFINKGSRWTFQASRMSGHLGDWRVILPDQMQARTYKIKVLLLEVNIDEKQRVKEVSHPVRK